MTKASVQTEKRFSTLLTIASTAVVTMGLTAGGVFFLFGPGIGEDLMETIPSDRRILLLPECLKNSDLCNAQHDEFGLLCKGCGSCPVSGIINHAENLGYNVLVSEGTTLPSRLIESGKTNAIIQRHQF